MECVSFDSAEEIVVAGATGGTVKLWDLEQAKGMHVNASQRKQAHRTVQVAALVALLVLSGCLLHTCTHPMNRPAICTCEGLNPLTLGQDSNVAFHAQ